MSDERARSAPAGPGTTAPPRRPDRAFALLAFAAALILLGALGSYGFWDPHEIRVADDASAIADGADPRVVVDDRPPLSTELVALGFRALGSTELAGRLPLALLGLVAVLATALLGRRLGGRGAGLLAGLVVLTSPALVLEARALTGAVATTAGAALLVLGGAGLAWPARGSRMALAGDAAAVVAGVYLVAGAAGGLVGLFPPLGALAIALAAAAAASDDRPRRRQLAAAAALTGLGAVAAVLWALSGAFDWVTAQPGDRAIAGHTLAVAREGAATSLGGAWRSRVPEDRTWNLLLENIAFGLFPWTGLLPFALRDAAAPTDKSPAVRFAGVLALAWALLGWTAATVFAIKVRPGSFPATPALALIIGLWLSRRAGAGAPALPLAGAAATLFVLILARDLTGFPARLPSLALSGDSLVWPKDLPAIMVAPVLLGVLFGAVAGVALARPAPPGPPSNRIERFLARPRRALAAVGRHGIAALVTLGLLSAATLSWVYVPTLSSQLSYKSLFDRVADVAGRDAPLALFNMRGSGARYYAGDSARAVASRAELAQLLRGDERVFALAPRSELCPLHQDGARAGYRVHVLDSDNAKYLLLSNQLSSGQRDQSPLAGSLSRSPPPDDEIATPLSASFDGKIELLGATMPAAVSRGDTFEMTLFFKVLERPRRNWRVFVHFDGGGVRFQGDHDPVERTCGTARWQPGDYIVDTFEVTAGGSAYGRTEYRVWVGFFTGSAGNWTNMPVARGEHDDADRVPIGTISLQ